MLNFLAMYQDRSTKLSDELFELKEKVEEVEKELKVIKTNLSKLESGEGKVKTERYLLTHSRLRVALCGEFL